MSVEQARHGNHNELTSRQKVGVAVEVGAMVGTAAEIIATGLLLWPIAIGGAIFLLGRGLVKSGRKHNSHKSH